MPRIVPSELVKIIDRIFPQLPGAPGLGRGNAGQLSALVNLVNELPDELLTMDNDSYAGLICGVEHIRQTLAAWVADRSARSNLDPVPGFAGASPVALVRTAILKCPDEAPAPATSELSFIIGYDQLRTNLRNDIGSIYRALANGEWKASTVLAGSAAEALLLWALKLRSPTDIASAVTAARASRDLTTNPHSDLDRWNLHEYIEVTAQLGIIKPNTAKQTRLAKDFRNFIHPGSLSGSAKNAIAPPPFLP